MDIMASKGQSSNSKIKPMRGDLQENDELNCNTLLCNNMVVVAVHTRDTTAVATESTCDTLLLLQHRRSPNHEDNDLHPATLER